MAKMLPKRYISEKAVKRALKIDSFRNLSKDKVMQFASMIPYTDKEVAIAIINQFPIFADFGKTAISCYVQMCDNILNRNQEVQNAAVQGYQTILDTLSRRMERENITEEERKNITEDMIRVADKIAEIDRQNKKFLERMWSGVIYGIPIITGIVGAGIGIKSAISGGELPQIEEDDNNE
ncbi:hypothetical protein FMM74_019150 [Lachnospiraceae bacterium MD308]|nr:hypothetical protein [Lachnospiraceae bacterium MD308]